MLGRAGGSSRLGRIDLATRPEVTSAYACKTDIDGRKFDVCSLWTSETCHKQIVTSTPRAHLVGRSVPERAQVCETLDNLQSTAILSLLRRPKAMLWCSITVTRLVAIG